jgi:hypothetical protein
MHWKKRLLEINQESPPTDIFEGILINTLT